VLSRATLFRAGVVILGLGLGVWAWRWIDASPPDVPQTYVGSENCAQCHAQIVERRRTSDHWRAMEPATPKTVLGDFADRSYTHFDVTSKMSREGDAFFMTTDGPDGKLQKYKIHYTFGFRPLQQYLVDFPGGKMQCLPLAWDTQDRRWFHLYPNEPIPYTDVLHWTRPLQNWNYMCADCHSTNLQRNFDLAATLQKRRAGVPTGVATTYHTTWSEINVSCETCHGPGSGHDAWAATLHRYWPRPGKVGLPYLKSADPRVEIETCAPCHARRRIVYPGFPAGGKFLDYYLPELLDNDLYYADGQIRDEDYEYGSFIQSKMYQNQVRCSNCHDPHTMRVKFKTGDRIEDNKLCGQCHLPAKYDAPAHHHHPGKLGTPGTLCIECHMPKTNYMVVDPRLDHSIRIPRPDLTVSLGIPNACTGCHHDASKAETPEWAEKTVRQWYGPLKGPQHFAYAIAAGRQNKPEGEELLDAVVRRKDASAMVRASALSLLGHYGPLAVEAAASLSLSDPDALVRVAAARSLADLEPRRRVRALVPLLHDEIRAVRIEAARSLSPLPRHLLPQQEAPALDAALQEFIDGQMAVAEQPGAHLSIGVIQANQLQYQQAEESYRTALLLDPQFAPAYINLAMLYDSQGKKDEAEKLFRKVIELEPKMADAYYSLGLLVAENEDRLAEAAKLLAQAAELAPQNARIHYNLGLALQRQQNYEAAESQLKRAFELVPEGTTDALDYLRALAILNVQQGRWQKALHCAEELVRRRPGDGELQQFLAQVRQQAARASVEAAPTDARP